MRRLAVNAFENDTPQGREQSAKALQKIKDARIVFSTCGGLSMTVCCGLNLDGP